LQHQISLGFPLPNRPTVAIFLLSMKDQLSDNIQSLYGRIAQACEEYDRDADDITIVAVTKRHPAHTISRAVAAGLHNIGESRVQEAEGKIEQLGRIARYHMVGHLQTNKVKKAVKLFDVIQSIDSLKVAEEINKEAARIDHNIECYIEINSSGEQSKYGIDPNECLDIVRRVNALEYIELTGLMTIGPLTDDTERVREAFRQTRELFEASRDVVGAEFDTLSMGMSADFELAIAEGSTMIRVGTELFGPRPE
jgi:hypothetical protein